jgi:hypothetical protein
MEDEAMTIAPEANSGIGRKNRALHRLDKKPFGSNRQSLDRNLQVFEKSNLALS